MYFDIKFLLLEAKQLKFYNAYPLMSDFGRFIPLCRVFFTNGHKKCPSTTNIETKYIAWRSSPHHNFAFKLKQPLLNT